MINKTILQGRLVRDPELNNTPNGVEVCKFTVAWSKKYKESENQCFLNCVAWRATGAFVNTYFKKGQEVVVEGELTTRSYEDKDGNKRATTELTCDQIHFCGSKQDGQGLSSNQQKTTAQPNLNDFKDISDDDDLPF